MKSSKSKIKNNTVVNVPSLGKIKAFFESMTLEDFKNRINSLMKKENNEDLHSFFYYIILFRDMENVQKCLNSESIPIEFLEELFMFTVGHCAIYGYTTESVLESMLFFLSNETLLKILQESKMIRKDKMLMFHILARLDINNLNKYFSEQKNSIDIVSAFYKLPEDIMKSIIAGNNRLFEYILNKLLINPVLKEDAEFFIRKYQDVIQEFNKMSDIVSQYHKKVNLTNEEVLPFDKRDMGRISYLVNTLRSLPDREKAIEYFTEEHVFADDHERQIVSALISDPFLKRIF